MAFTPPLTSPTGHCVATRCRGPAATGVVISEDIVTTLLADVITMNVGIVTRYVITRSTILPRLVIAIRQVYATS